LTGPGFLGPPPQVGYPARTLTRACRVAHFVAADT
jgi:hypothetical protein